LKSADVGLLSQLVVNQIRAGLLERYKQVMAAKDFKTEDIDAGREYVEKYVRFIHYVEGMYEAVTRPVKGHYPEGDEDSHQER